MSKKGRQQGELESQVLDALWSVESPLTSQQILERVSPDGQLALTTILTVLSRLADKGAVIRAAGEGRALLFSAQQSREQFAADSMLKVFAAAGDSKLALSHFAEGLSAAQLEALRQALK
jgi:predicted transcriptional regulator